MVMEATAASAASRAEVDTSRPFQSVREAVVVFGERYAGDGGSSSNASSESSVKLSASSMMLDCLKKLEADLAEAKCELVQLKQRQSQMEMAMSSLSVQFSNGLDVISGLSKGKEVAVVGAPATGEDDGNGWVRSDRWDESRAEEWMANLEYLPSLSEALTIKMIENDFGERKEGKVKSKKAARKKHKKQKNGISLVGGIFSKKSKSR
ncbi:WEB family protein At1g75720-like [Phragmites australis]|uniref:WEB family protein At1g75720-like n=1 Tax=Phragmites australis TaxID=29695 RepID=UPI002D78244B|nr:WEB family protein At1g75720-like [Phragmites australis]